MNKLKATRFEKVRSIYESFWFKIFVGVAPVYELGAVTP